MKQTFLVFLLTLFLCSSASAFSLFFDADGDGQQGNSYSPIALNYLKGYTQTPSTSSYLTFQTLGTDNILNDGDRFYHEDPLYINILHAQDGSGSLPENYPQRSLYAKISGIEGTISNYNSGSDGVDTTPTNPSAIVDDSFSLSYQPGVGDIELYFDPTEDFDTTDAVKFADLKIVKGGGSTYNEDLNSSLSAQVGFDFEFTNLKKGYFFFNDSGSIGTDISDWMAQGNNMFMGISDGSINLEETEWDSENIHFSSVTTDNGTNIGFYATPEPSTLILFGLGLLGLAGFSRKKFSKK